MGRLPATYADRPILDRWPYEMPGELAVATNQISTVFPSAMFQNTVDKPFEVHRMIPRFVALDAEQVPLAEQPDQDLLASLVKINIKQIGFEQLLTKAPTRPIALTKGTAERTWEWADPNYLTRSDGYEVSVQALTFPAGIADLVYILVLITFEGFLCIVAPPTNNR